MTEPAGIEREDDGEPGGVTFSGGVALPGASAGNEGGAGGE